MKTVFRKNSKVEWKWLGRKIQGVIEESFKESVTKTIKTKKITRHGTEGNPAYLVKSEAGNYALKLHSELAKPQTKSSQSAKADAATAKSGVPGKRQRVSTKTSPKMFA